MEGVVVVCEVDSDVVSGIYVQILALSNASKTTNWTFLYALRFQVKRKNQ